MSAGRRRRRPRRAVMNTIEKESLDKTGLRSDVITLYHGGEYHLYRYKKYTDVRLVFAPEQDIAFFGGDPDNFEYPRYDLDICFFHVYEDGKPAKVEHLSALEQSGRRRRTNWCLSREIRARPIGWIRCEHLEFLRDRMYPSSLRTIFRREVLLSAYSQRSLENARRAKDDLFGYQNTRKARLGGLAGLQDPAIMERKNGKTKGVSRCGRQRIQI